MLARGHGKESSMDAQRSSTLPVVPTAVVNENYRLLFEAALNGDRKTVLKIFNEYREAIMAPVMTVEDVPITLLEVAITGTQDELVEELVKGLPLDYDDDILMRALINAAQRGRIRMVKALIDKVHPRKPEIVALALSYAVECGHSPKEVIRYLALNTKSAPDYDTMTGLIAAGHLDIGLYLYGRYPDSMKIEDTDPYSISNGLVKMRSCFPGEARLNFWEKTIYKCIPLCLVNTFGNSEDTKMARALNWFKISLWNLATKAAPFIKRIGELKLWRNYSLKFGILALDSMKSPHTVEILLNSGIVLGAASHGIFEFVQLCVMCFPELMWEKNFMKELIKEVVKGRCVELLKLVNVYDESTRRSLMDAVVEWSSGCAPANVSGAAFLIQRELQWFKVVEHMSDPSLKSLKFKVLKEKDEMDPSFQSLKLVDTKDGRGKTYWEVFVEQRQDLLKEAGLWMKDTSSSCSLIGTLIITVAFAAAFTVPGGNDGSTGIPIFLKKGSFIFFAIADALALFSSVTATLMFLAILLSRYAIEDFHHSLPRKMILGLTFLFLSLAFMLVAFGSALTIVLGERLKWIYIPITLLAAFPVILFAILQLPLYVEMAESTYRSPLYVPSRF